MVSIMMFLVCLPGVAIICWTTHLLAESIRIRIERNRLSNLPAKTEYGRLSINNIQSTTHFLDSYTVDNKGTIYTHIGGGGEISVLQSYTLWFEQGKDFMKPEKAFLLYSLPGEKSFRRIASGCGMVTYVTDTDGKHYYISIRPCQMR